MRGAGHETEHFLRSVIPSAFTRISTLRKCNRSYFIAVESRRQLKFVGTPNTQMDQRAEYVQRLPAEMLTQIFHSLVIRKFPCDDDLDSQNPARMG